MNAIAKSVLLTLILAAVGPRAEAEEALALRGVFCLSEAQILTVQEHMRAGLLPRMAAALMNRDKLVCVYADRIHYVVERPTIFDEVRDGPTVSTTYAATLTGVRVGDNLRPITPPMPIYFITPDPVEGAIFLGKA